MIENIINNLVFEDTERTLIPGRMRYFETNEDGDTDVEIESKSYKCFKIVISKDKVVESLLELKIGVSVPFNIASEKIFYALNLTEFEIYAKKNKLDVSKIKNQLPNVQK